MKRSIDGLRGLAIMMVLLLHCGAPFSRAGWLGVDLFFVISGFLITALLLDEHRKNGSISLHMFWARRFLRLMPIYILYVGCISLAMLLGPSTALGNSDGWTPLQFILAQWAYLSNLTPRAGIWQYQNLTGHLWSLSVEEQFYLLWPILLVAFVKTRWLESLMWSFLAFVIINNIVSYSGRPPIFQLDTRGISIFIGCAFAISLQKHKIKLKQLSMISSRATVVSFCAVALSLATMSWYSEIYRLNESPFLPIGVPIFALSAAFLIANLWVNENGYIGRILSLWPLPQVGKISYGIYIYHIAIQQFVWGTTGSIQDWPRVPKYGFRFSVFLILTFAIATLSYRFIESPFLRLKKNFRLPKVKETVI